MAEGTWPRLREEDVNAPLPDPSQLGLAQLVHHREVDSTMDVAHALAAAGAPAGVLVIADRQLRGRGRSGHRWASDSGAGLWMTLIERPTDSGAINVLSLRLGLVLAEALQGFVDVPVRLKWPNDAFLGDGKVAGILVEARWRDSVVDWIAIGIGINRTLPANVPGTAALPAGVSRNALLAALVPGVRAAAAREGLLTREELAAWSSRDVSIGRHIVAPMRGTVRGISADGALLVSPDAGGEVVAVRTGSMVFDDHRLSRESGC